MLTGNRDYNEIYEQYKNLVLQVAYIYSGRDYHAAEDIAQDILLKLYEGYDDFDKEKIKAWLSVVAKNMAINYMKKRDKEYFSEDYDSIAENELIKESIEDEYMENVHDREAKSLHDQILEGLMEKNPRWHDAVLLAYYMDIPQERAAEIMGVRIGVLHSILHRAKVWIRKTYSTEYEEMRRK